MNQSHEQYMARAIELAQRGLYTTDPNPRVGCVLVKDGQVVGEGWHQKAGEGHAEVNAIAVAGVETQGSTVYVTLEPCSHFGKTPPCCEALIKAKVAKVIAAMTDPNPLVAGKGFDKLRAAGIEVVSGVLESEAQQLNPGFNQRMETGLPFVRCKMAMSLDGRTAMASGESQWITGAAARSDVQKLRARSSAIVTGIGSVLLDDPSLTVRAAELGVPNADEIAKRQPLRVVLDSSLQLPINAKVAADPSRLIVVTADIKNEKAIALQSKGITLWQHDTKDLKGLLVKLADVGCNEVLFETGATLAGSLVASRLVDEVIVYMAPKLLGSQARPLFNLPFDHMAEQVGLEIKDVRAVGEDWRITAHLAS